MHLLVLNRVALVMIARNKLRTALTMLGIAIGERASTRVQTAIADLRPG